jgi:DNA-binding transcriptional LysR family regulator
MQIDWDDARYFYALAKSLNLDRAAESLESSSATVMRRVKNLETSLGATLFIRNKTGHQLTRAGIRFLAAVNEAGMVLNTASQELFNQDRLVGGKVRVSTTEVAAQWVLLPELIAHPPDEFFNIEIDVDPQPLSLAQELDTIAIRFQRPVDEHFVVKKLATIKFSLYRKRPTERMSRRKQIEHIRDYGRPAAQNYLYIGWSRAFEHIGPARWLSDLFSGIEPRIRLASMQSHLDACLAGLGIALLPDFIAGIEPTLEIIESNTINPNFRNQFDLDVWLVMPSRMRHLERVKRVNRFIEAAFERQFRNPK